MKHPSTLHLHRPPCVRRPGLHKHLGLWACAEGVTSPVVYVDSGAEAVAGFEALMFHEALHVIDRHAFWGCVFAALPPLWMWWRREVELRADVFAYEGAGDQEFYNFVHMHPHPTGWFWKWCYGKTRGHRIERTRKRWQEETTKWHAESKRSR